MRSEMQVLLASPALRASRARTVSFPCLSRIDRHARSHMIVPVCTIPAFGVTHRRDCASSDCGASHFPRLDAQVLTALPGKTAWMVHRAFMV